MVINKGKEEKVGKRIKRKEKSFFSFIKEKKKKLKISFVTQTKTQPISLDINDHFCIYIVLEMLLIVRGAYRVVVYRDRYVFILFFIKQRDAFFQ
jgi:hypothetical protein